MELPTTHTVVHVRGWGEGGEGGGGRIPGRMGGGLVCCRRLLCSGGLLWGWQLGLLWLPGWDLLLRWGRQCATAASLVLPTSEHGASRRASKRFPMEIFGQVLLWSVTGVRVPLSTTPGKLMVSMSLISSLFCFSALANLDLRIPLSDFNCRISKLRTESLHWNASICEVSSVIWTASFDILTGIVRHESQLHTPVYSVSSPQHTVWYHAMHTEHRIILDAVGARQLGFQRKVVRFLVFLVGVPFRDVFLLFFLAADFVLRETLFKTPPACDSAVCKMSLILFRSQWVCITGQSSIWWNDIFNHTTRKTLKVSTARVTVCTQELCRRLGTWLNWHVHSCSKVMGFFFAMSKSGS